MCDYSYFVRYIDKICSFIEKIKNFFYISQIVNLWKPTRMYSQMGR